jgi:LPXTG-motif cell wall-anchored protein
MLALIPHAFAQTAPQLSLTLVGQGTGQYVTPVGQTTELKMEILNVARPDIYLLEGDAYLDPNLNGTWEITHSEALGNFHLAYLQSAIWTFDLPMPPRIQAANATKGMPQVDLLIKIVYRTAEGSQRVEQGAFTLGAPGAIIRGQSNMIWLALAGVIVVLSMGALYGVSKRRRAR